MRKLKEETSQKQGFGKQCQANFKALRGLKDSNTYPKEILKNDKWKVTGSGSDMSPIWWALCIHHSCLGILCRLYPFLFALGYPWHSAISRRTSWGTAGCLGCLETRGDDLLQRLFNGKQKIYWVLLKLQWEPKLGISIFFKDKFAELSRTTTISLLQIASAAAEHLMWIPLYNVTVLPPCWVMGGRLS